LDSLAPARFVPDRARLLDIGSGAGFPGIPLKIFKPSLSVLLIDGTRKKVHFLKHMIRSLGLDRIEALHIRAENLGHHPAFTCNFNVIISRALSDLTFFVEVATSLLARQGTILAMKGEVAQNELRALGATMANDQFILDVEHYNLPIDNHQRAVVILKALD
jgi:16S rRNA (guanine527-N7)-methyltransferase